MWTGLKDAVWPIKLGEKVSVGIYGEGEVVALMPFTPLGANKRFVVVKFQNPKTCAHLERHGLSNDGLAICEELEPTSYSLIKTITVALSDAEPDKFLDPGME